MSYWSLEVLCVRDEFWQCSGYSQSIQNSLCCVGFKSHIYEIMCEKYIKYI